MIGQEARASGFNVMLAGGVNLVREPRNGRNFEYAGEDPLLAGKMIGAQIKGIQSNNIISTLKHYALNNQETGRNIGNVITDESAARTSELMAFQIALKDGNPGSVMCAYNKVNGFYSCENDFLLNKVLKGDWGFTGYVMSDWGGVHSTIPAVNSGLDQESAYGFDRAFYFGPALKEAVDNGWVPAARLDDMVRRVLGSMFAHGLFDLPLKETPINFAANAKITQQTAEAGMVLLKNANEVLPINKNVKKIAVIGGHADIAVLSGGGSSQVYGQGGNPIKTPQVGIFPKVYHPSSPVQALRELLPASQIDFNSGADLEAAQALAASADITLVFATQWTSEAYDVESLNLPDGQNELIAAIAKANPKTVVVLQTGGPVLMPWLNQTAGVLQAWYPGTEGGKAIARVLTGAVNPSGRLPITYPADTNQLPQKTIAGTGRKNDEVPFDIHYPEGATIGYKWYDQQKLTPLFPFGFGLSYSQFTASKLTAEWSKGQLQVAFNLANSGKMAGKPLGLVFAQPAAAIWEAPKRLVGFARADLKAGANKKLQLSIDPLMLAVYQPQSKTWQIAEGDYDIRLAQHAMDNEAQVVRIHLAKQTLDIKGNLIP
jgi:beta-glucosidase